MMSEKTNYERYVNDDLLAKTFLFRSARGQKLGLANTKIASWVDFGENFLNIRTMPVSYESIREIPYRDISFVQAKRYINLYYLISVILFIVLAFFTQGVGLIGAAIILWIGMGSKVEIRLNDGRTVCLFSVNSLSYAKEFENFLNATIQRARNGEVYVSQIDENVDIESAIFIKRNMDMNDKNKQSWNTMLSLLNAGQSSVQMLEQLCASITPDKKDVATNQVNTELFTKGIQKVVSELNANETPYFYYDKALTFKLKKFYVLTDKKIIFYVDGKVHSVPYDKVYKLSHWGSGLWFVNGLPTPGGADEAISTAILTSEQVGMILAIICRESIEQRGLHKIVINNSTE